MSSLPAQPPYLAEPTAYPVRIVDHGDLSRNRKVGLLLAQGQSLPEAVKSLGHVAEGVYCARTVLQRAASLGVDMPIAQSVVALLDGQLKPAEAVTLLMEREPRTEQA